VSITTHSYPPKGALFVVVITPRRHSAPYCLKGPIRLRMPSGLLSALRDLKWLWVGVLLVAMLAATTSGQGPEQRPAVPERLKVKHDQKDKMYNVVRIVFWCLLSRQACVPPRQFVGTWGPCV